MRVLRWVYYFKAINSYFKSTYYNAIGFWRERYRDKFPEGI